MEACHFGSSSNRNEALDSYFEVCCGVVRTSGSATTALDVGPAELDVLRAAVAACVARAGRHSRILVARAAEALDDLREDLARADRLIAEQQERIDTLYELFTAGDGGER